MKREEILRKLKKELDGERFKHSLGVEKTAVLLARKHGVSAKAASIAALLHDYARKYSRKELTKQAKRFKLKSDSLHQAEPKLFHAKLSALLAKKEFGITSGEILKAIKKHTLGSPAMTKLEKIIYLADHIEEGRNFSGVNKIRALAAKNLDQAVVASAGEVLKYMLKTGLFIHPGTIQTRNYYLLKLK